MAKVMRSLASAVLMATTITTARLAAAEPTPVATAKKMPPLRKAGWITLGSGGALLVGSGVLFAMSARDYPGARDHERESVHAFSRELFAAKILCTVGVLAAGTGLTLVLLSSKNDDVRVTAGLARLEFGARF